MNPYAKAGKLDFQRVECALCKGRRCEACDHSGYTLERVVKTYDKHTLQDRERRMRRGLPADPKQCKRCGAAFTSTVPQQVYCTHACYVIGNRLTQRDRAKEKRCL